MQRHGQLPPQCRVPAPSRLRCLTGGVDDPVKSHCRAHGHNWYRISEATETECLRFQKVKAASRGLLVACKDGEDSVQAGGVTEVKRNVVG